MGDPNNTQTEEQSTAPLISRRGALKAGAVTASATALGGVGMWYISQPVVAAEITNAGAEDVVFGTEEDVTSVIDVTIQPEIDVAFNNFSSGVADLQLAITVQVDAEQVADETYEGNSDTWNAPAEGASEFLTISGTIAADGTENTIDFGFGQFQVQTPDLTQQTNSSIGTDDNFDFQEPIPLQDVLEEDGAIGATEGIQMFPQNIDPDHYGLSVVDVDYAVTLVGANGDEDTDNSPAHVFDVAVENVGGTVTDSEIDSNTDGTGEDGVGGN